MFDDEDRAYFARRAEEARAKAAEAIDPAIKKIHADMAKEYDRRANGDVPRKVPRI